MAAFFQNFLSSFFLVGINYKKSDVCARGRFSIDKITCEGILQAEKLRDPNASLFIVSTCNRTEIYGTAVSADSIQRLLCDATDGKLEELISTGYVKCGTDAINHLFDVASGLDSQILGDYEIIGQIRQAVKQSKERGCINAVMERLLNEVFAAAKNIRTNTTFSGGSTSVSYAAVQFLQKQTSGSPLKNCLVIGAGKLGSITCKNILSYLPGMALTVINRTEDKARELAASEGIVAESMANLSDAIEQADVVITATFSDSYIIEKKNIHPLKHPKFFIDLSVPCNVKEDVKELAGVTLINVDELSKISDTTLAIRKGQVPAVKTIIHSHKESFHTWLADRKHAPVLHAAKYKLQEIANKQDADSDKKSNKEIQKALNGLAVRMKASNEKGCHYLTTLHEYLQSSKN